MLKAGFIEGRLTKEEYEDRVGRVYTSLTYAELAAITVDLPTGSMGAAIARSQQQPVVPVEQRINRLAKASFMCALFPGIPGVAAIAMGIIARGADQGARRRRSRAGQRRHRDRRILPAGGRHLRIRQHLNHDRGMQVCGRADCTMRCVGAAAHPVDPTTWPS